MRSAQIFTYARIYRIGHGTHVGRGSPFITFRKSTVCGTSCMVERAHCYWRLATTFSWQARRDREALSLKASLPSYTSWLTCRARPHPRKSARTTASSSCVTYRFVPTARLIEMPGDVSCRHLCVSPHRRRATSSARRPLSCRVHSRSRSRTGALLTRRRHRRTRWSGRCITRGSWLSSTFNLVGWLDASKS